MRRGNVSERAEGPSHNQPVTAELHLLGGAALRNADGALVAGAAAQPRRLAVLAVLADAWPAPVTRDRLVGLIWPDQDEQGARRLLTQALYALRRELGDCTSASGRDVALNLAGLQVDLIEFRRALAEGDVQRAAGLYRGPVLDGVHVRGAVEFERWIETLRDATRRQFQAAVEQITAECGAAGDWREAAHWAERLVREAPYDAQATLRLIDCWLAAGDRGAALAAATAYERRIREELEIEPDPVVRQRIREAVRPPVESTGGASGATAAPAAVRPPAEDVVAPQPPAIDGGATTQGPVGRMRWRMRWLAWPVLAAGLGATMLLARSTPVRSDARVVELLPVRVRGDSSLAAYGVAAGRVLRANIDGIGGVHVVVADSSAAGEAPWARLRTEIVAVGAQIRLDAELVLSGDEAPARRHATVFGSRDSLLVLAERLTIGLLPGLYPAAVAERAGAATIQAFHRAEAARHYLDGEAALRRGAFDAAHAHFRAATQVDPGPAQAWYRRAVAAEAAHRIDDVDLSLREAERRQATLPDRGRIHLQGYRRWRSGDARGAEAIYRALLTQDGTDREAWFQLAEIALHGGPLHGHAIARARDPWYRVVAFDSGDVPALTHGIRVAAHARDTAMLHALLAHAERAGAAGAPLSESRVIAAYALGDRRAVAGAERILDSIPEYSLQFLQGVVAGQLEQLDAARGIARRMIAPTRPAAIQGQGYLALAHLALAQGRWREAMRTLDSAAVRNPVAAGWARAYFATLPFVQVSAEVRRDAAERLAAVPSAAEAAPLYLQTGVASPAAAVIQPYLEQLLRPAGGDALACDESLPDESVRDLCHDLRLALAAEPAWRAGRAADALRLLDSLALRVPYQFAGRSQFFARSRERFLRAWLLERLGQHAEAEAWYEASAQGAWADYIFLAPAHLGRAQARERRGDAAAAAVHYRKVIAIMRQPDPELAWIRRAADAGLARVTAR